MTFDHLIPLKLNLMKGSTNHIIKAWPSPKAAPAALIILMPP